MTVAPHMLWIQRARKETVVRGSEGKVDWNTFNIAAHEWDASPKDAVNV